MTSKDYDAGMPRLSCALCIFAPRAALLLAGRLNPELLDEYCAVEEEIGHTFQHKRSLAEMRQAIRDGETPDQLHGIWNMRHSVRRGSQHSDLTVCTQPPPFRKRNSRSGTAAGNGPVTPRVSVR